MTKNHFVCIFTITTYGDSGTELPPPRHESRSIAIESDVEFEIEFKKKMDELGAKIRAYLELQFYFAPRPYSCADSVSWNIVKLGEIGDLLK